jgi:hypothetical protein
MALILVSQTANVLGGEQEATEMQTIHQGNRRHQDGHKHKNYMGKTNTSYDTSPTYR